MVKAKHCDECKNSVVKEVLLTGGHNVMTCALGHKPRFFKPRYIHDYQWGWKRNCTDYEQIAKHRETEAAERSTVQSTIAALRERLGEGAET